MMLFSLLNFKDMLDVIEVVNVEKKHQLARFTDFFSSVDCTKAQAIYALEGQLDSNRRTTRFLLQALGMAGTPSVTAGGVDALAGADAHVLLAEYKRNFNSGLRAKRNCSNRISFVEYVTVVSIVVYFVFKTVMLVGLVVAIRLKRPRRRSSASSAIRPKGRQTGSGGLSRLLSRLEAVVLKNLLFLVMLGYFENVISYCVSIGLVKSAVFGVKDFAFVTVRGFFIFYPVWLIQAQQREYEQCARRQKSPEPGAPRPARPTAQKAVADGRPFLAETGAKAPQELFADEPEAQFPVFPQERVERDCLDQADPLPEPTRRPQAIDFFEKGASKREF